MVPQQAQQDALKNRLGLLWADVLRALPGYLCNVSIYWGVGASAHFDTRRGFATTSFDGTSTYLKLSEKLLTAGSYRVEGVLRHEMGHIVDLNVPWPALDAWAEERGADLPHTPERRADAIAGTIWGSPVYYDVESVQTTLSGTSPRPEDLGL